MDLSALERDADTAAARGDFAGALDLLLRATEADPSHFNLWLKRAAMSRATGDPRAALVAIERALAFQPLDFTALLMRAMQLEATGNVDKAGEAFGRALAQAPDTMPPQLAPIIANAKLKFRAWQDKQAAAMRAAVPVLTDALERMITNAVHLTTPDREGPTHYCYPGLPEIPFHDRAHFPWLATLEAATASITAEFEAVAAAHAAELVPYIQYPENVPLEQWRALNQNRDWTAIHLIERGRVVDANRSEERRVGKEC